MGHFAKWQHTPGGDPRLESAARDELADEVLLEQYRDDAAVMLLNDPDAFDSLSEKSKTAFVLYGLYAASMYPAQPNVGLPGEVLSPLKDAINEAQGLLDDMTRYYARDMS
jgi:hypothetical protein